ncbi:phospholipase D-like domain-containing protein [Aureimonas jatrophae]|uniref:Phospholipase D n=1 Tax=Aureimonas jatrophae TaxID=1166073 RepID=A0A1H0HX07_9HYPH|nr:phospholipase D-like domain-containing protein [Aureimonas jatrophae]MBB3950822.1 phospholipase D1/2 [Aureimonas jatrophae]SDO23736.1 Phospholipase D Active site motif-containing protein [Aureimonas jatrophae]
MNSRLRETGKTVWQTGLAERFAVIVDGADYYRFVKQAILKARFQVLMIGWDFDTRVEFEPGGRTLEGPNELGPFLNWMVAERNPALDIRILKWNLGILETVKRGETPFFVLQWLWGKGVTLKLDAAHPLAASHHQKIIIIDDAIAFCGGIDITKGRWDTREHRDGDPDRHSPRGQLLDPWHDATTCVTGEAARLLGDLGRARWSRATDEAVGTPPAHAGDLWPDGLEPALRNVEIGISRTMGAFDLYPQVSEIEAMTLAAIASARRHLYIESQYFASRRIAEAIAARLAEPDGPEVVVVNPESQDGWLEEKTMGAARARLLRLVHRADRHQRFGIFYPVTREGEPIYVHAKIMIVDDRFLKIGSSNLNNRSMGFDTECDLSLEADGDDAVAGAIRHIRDDLIAEHLDMRREEVEHALRRDGSILRLVRESGREGRRQLVPLPVRELDAADEALGEAELVDPERPPRFLRGIRRRLGLR